MSSDFKLKFKLFFKRFGLLVFILIAICALLGGGIYLLEKARNDVSKREHERYTVRICEYNSGQIGISDSYLSDAIQDIGMLANELTRGLSKGLFEEDTVIANIDDHAKTATNVKAKTEVSKIVQSYNRELISYILVANADGLAYLGNISEYEYYKDLSMTGFMKTSMQGTTVLSDLGNSVIDDDSVFVASTPVIDENATVQAVVCAVFRRSVISNVVGVMAMEEFSSTLINEKATLITVTPPNIDDDVFTQAFYEADSNEEGERDFLFNGIDGTVYMAHGAPFVMDEMGESVHWYMISFAPYKNLTRYLDEYNNKMRVAVDWFCLFIVVSAALCLLWAFWMQREKRMQLNKYGYALQMFNKYIIEYDSKTNTLFFSKDAANLFGIHNLVQSWENVTKSGILSEQDTKTVIEAIERARTEGHSECDMYFKYPNKYMHVVISKRVKRFRHECDLISIVEDVTDIIKLNRELSIKAHTDSLTGVENREGLETAVANTIAQYPYRRHAMFLIDLDQFKAVNDKYGHIIGDELLKKTARAISSVASKVGNYTVARFGGDEFCLFVSCISTSKVIEDIAFDLCSGISTVTIKDDDDYTVTCSVGVSVYPKHGTTFEQLYRYADNALYNAKDKAGDRYCIYDELGTAVDDKNDEEVQLVEDDFSLLVEMSGTHGKERVEKALMDAMKKNEFALMLQPKVGVKPPHAIEAEVLSRWQSPKYGLLMPSKFIPLFEKTKLIERYDLYVLERSLNLISECEANGITCGCVSVNQSLKTMLSPDYVKIVTNLLKKYDKVCATRVMLEISERGLFISLHTIAKTVKALRALGLKISIDDFGTGNTTLAIIKDLQVDEIKIDKVFVHDCTDERTDAIVRAMSEMAQRIGVTTVAEGVETEEQARFLSDCGYDYLQGFYFARAIPATEYFLDVQNECKEKMKKIVDETQGEKI